MYLAIIGYGKMGKLIEALAVSHGHTVVAKFNSSSYTLDDLVGADVCLEFSHPNCALENIKKLIAFKKQLVVGTTGWYDHVDEVEALVEQAGIGMVYSPNFSLGVQLFFQCLEQAAQIFSPFKDYEAAGVEYHGASKKDAPSGTAKYLSKIVEDNLLIDKTVPFTSVRIGHIPGTHTLLFDSPYDTIEFTHRARNREGFAKGALFAADWIQGKKGLYTFEECIQTELAKDPL